METLWHDLRFGARMLVKYPALAATGAVALALGVGLTTTVFSIVHGAFLRGLPFEESHELMHIGCVRAPGTVTGVSLHDYRDWQERQRAFEDLAAFATRSVNLSGPEGFPERYDGAFVTVNLFDVLRIQPLVGRGFREGEDSPAAEPVAVVSHSLWWNRFGGSATLVGRSIRVDGEVMTVVGVMPERFRFPQSHDIWIPLRLDPVALPRGTGPTLQVVGRLRDGETEEGASVDLAGIAAQLEKEHPETNQGVRPLVQPFIHRFVPYEQRAGFLTMLAAVFGVLLVACANVANLLLARTVSREKEIAVRSALGAGRGRLLSQLLAESFVLALGGSLLGLGVAYLGIDLFNRAVVDHPPPFWMDFRIDTTAVGFVVFLTFISSFLSGVVPALRASGTNMNEALKEESRGSSGLRLGKLGRAVVVAEIALSCALLLASGVMAVSIIRLKQRQFPFATEDVLRARVGLAEADYPDRQSRLDFYREFAGRLEGLPGIRRVVLASDLPGLGGTFTVFAVEGTAYPSEQELPRARLVVMTPGALDALGISLLEGREFRSTDDEDSAPVAIVNRSLAEKSFGRVSPVGARFRFADSEAWVTIIGVAPDVMIAGSPFDESPEGIYLPLAQNPLPQMSVAIRAAGDPLALAPMVREAVAALDPNLPVYGASTLYYAISSRTWFVDVFGSLFVIFGVAALALAGIGLYGVVAFSVGHRVHEMGIRRALGARDADLWRLILRQAVSQIVLGLLFGSGLGLGLCRLVEGLLYGVRFWEPAVVLSVLCLLSFTGLVACLIPARRGVLIDPALALRHE